MPMLVGANTECMQLTTDSPLVATCQRKARLVAGGHKTPAPEDPAHSSAAALRSLCIATLLAELNGLQIMAGDVS